MSEKDDPNIKNIMHIDEARLRRMSKKGHTLSMLEEYEMLKLKFLYSKLDDRIEAMRLVTLCKYFMEKGPTELIRLSSSLFYDKYINGKGI